MSGGISTEEIERLRLRITALEQQLDTYQRILLEQAGKLEHSLKDYRNLLESAPDAIVMTDGQGRILRLNSQAEALYGYDRSELVGQHVEILIPERFRQRHVGQRTGYISQPRRRPMGAGLELYGQRKDGREFPVDIALSPMEVGGETVVISIIRDMTERAREEQELHRAKETAEAANRAKSEFLANISHEIRTPMNGILGMMDLVLETELTAEQREYLGTVKASAEALLMVINDVLDFSKIEAGKLDLEPIAFDLDEVLGGTVEALAWQAHEKGLELAFHIPQGVPEALVGDPIRLRQVLTNVIGNALKFTERGEVVVRVVTVGAMAGDEVSLHFTVRDTGIGIPAHEQQRIFDAFAQADGSLTRRYEGTGLGLTISSRLIAMMGGKIWVESQVGQGSTFHFTAHFGLQQTPMAARHTGIPDSWEGLPVLIVDDNATSRLILNEVLRGWTLKPTPVDGAAAALEGLCRAVVQEPFALLLLDATMPDVDGFALARRVV
jgi:PAS domain S-box-containing protein